MPGESDDGRANRAEAGTRLNGTAYSHCSPTIVHFHVGRSNAPIDIACFNHSMSIDDQQIYRTVGY
jgi:hypothetical protein